MSILTRTLSKPMSMAEAERLMREQIDAFGAADPQVRAALTRKPAKPGSRRARLEEELAEALEHEKLLEDMARLRQINRALFAAAQQQPAQTTDKLMAEPGKLFDLTKIVRNRAGWLQEVTRSDGLVVRVKRDGVGTLLGLHASDGRTARVERRGANYDISGIYWNPAA
jgi:hypothetical protein